MFCALLHCVCTKYVSPSEPVVLPGMALQMSPISPLVRSYHASGGPTDGAIPTSGSVIVSTSSCEATAVTSPNTELVWPCPWQPLPACMSGWTP